MAGAVQMQQQGADAFPQGGQAVQGIPVNTASSSMQPPPSQMMVDVLEEYIPLPEVHYDVTNQFESCCLFIHFPCAGWLSKKLVLEDQEAVLRQKNLCCKSTKRMPYAQLGNVMTMEVCCGCTAVGSELAPIDEENGGGGISPGCGCDKEMCKRIENEMQQRKLLRGNVAQVNKLEHMGNKIGEVAYGIDALLTKYGVPHEPEQSLNSGLDNFFGTKEFNNLACCCESLFCVSHRLVLDKEESIHFYSDCCTNAVSKREYAQLGYVGRSKNCFCCRAVSSDAGSFTPGCGCNRTLVNEVVEELQARKIARGNVGQIREQERLLHKLRRINTKMDTLEMNMGIAYPPDAQTMSRIFAKAPGGVVPGVPAPAKGALDGKEQRVQDKSYNTTNSCENCMTCCCLETSIDMLDDEYHEHEKDCCDNSIMKIPYAQMESVDYEKCCCIYSVNNTTPGCFCNGEIVQEIAHELQDRKVKRGNILQLQQLEAFQATAQELDLRTHLYLDKNNIAYPPKDPNVIAQVYGQPTVRILDTPFGLMHKDASMQFEPKDYGDVTNFWECLCCFICCCGPLRKRANLLEEELMVTHEATCYRSAIRKPWAQLGDVEVSNCMCCLMVDDVGSPGCGCNQRLVNDIAADLQKRKVLRGNIAQLKVQENIMKEVLKIDAKLRYLHYQLR